MLTFRGLDRVLGDLSEMGFNAQWGVMGASAFGANHRRERIWILAYSQRLGREERAKERGKFENKKTSNQFDNGSQAFSNSSGKNVEGQWQVTFGDKSQFRDIGDASWWLTEPNVGRVAHGVEARVDRLKAIGNGQVPLCAANAWRILNEL